MQDANGIFVCLNVLDMKQRKTMILKVLFFGEWTYEGLRSDNSSGMDGTLKVFYL